MNEEISKNQPKNQGCLWWVIGIIIFFFIVEIISNNNQPAATTNDNYNNAIPSQSVSKQPSLSAAPTEPLICTNFQYSEWSHCATDGTQSRTIVTALPEGCSGGNTIQLQNCKYEPLPSGTTGEKLYQRMIDQIKNAPNHTISTNYVAGTDAGNITNLTWQVNDDGLYLYVKAYRVSNPEVKCTLCLDSIIGCIRCIF